MFLLSIFFHNKNNPPPILLQLLQKKKYLSILYHMMTNNKFTTPIITIALRQQGIPADPTLWSDEHFQVYVRKHTLKTMTPPDGSDSHGY